MYYTTNRSRDSQYSVWLMTATGWATVVSYKYVGEDIFDSIELSSALIAKFDSEIQRPTHSYKVVFYCYRLFGSSLRATLCARTLLIIQVILVWHRRVSRRPTNTIPTCNITSVRIHNTTAKQELDY